MSRCRALAFGIFGVLGLLFIVLVLFSGNAMAADSGPLEYVGDAELAQAVLDGECTGNGTEASPYVFTDYVLECTGSSYGIWLKDTEAHVLVSNCTFNNCTVTVGDVQGFAIYLMNCTNVTVLGCDFDNCERGIAVHLSDNCHLIGNDLSGVSVSGVSITDSELIRTESNHMDATLSPSTYGFYLQGSNNISINDTEILECTKGIYADDVDRIIIDNLTLSQQSQYAFELKWCDDVTVLNSTLLSAPTGIYGWQITSFSISGSHMELNGGYGILLTDGTTVWIEDNVINGGEVSILLQSCLDVHVVNNTCNAPTTYGMQLSVGGGEVSDNVLFECQVGIYLQCGNLTLRNNQIRGISGPAILAQDSTGLLIDGNVLFSDSWASTGIDLNTCYDSILCNNTVNGTFRTGICLTMGDNITASNNAFSYVALDDQGLNALRIVGASNLTLMNNTADGIVANGIYAEESYHILISGNVINGLEEGIRLHYCYDVLVMDNDLDHSVSNGILVSYGGGETARITISNNSCRFCGSGIVLTQTHYTILEGNDCGDCQIGINIGSSQLTYIGNCTADRSFQGLQISSGGGTFVFGGSYGQCTLNGIYLGTSDSTHLEGVNSSGNGNYGLYLSNSIQGYIINSTFSGNIRGVHVYLDESHHQPFYMTGCRLENNTGYGIYSEGGWLVNVKGNHLANNLDYAMYLLGTSDDWYIHNNTFLNNRGVVGLNELAIQCYDEGSNNRWYVYEGDRNWGNGWSHLPNLDVNGDGYVDYQVRIGGSLDYYRYQLPYGPKIEGPSAPTNLAYELTPYYIDLNWTAPASLGNSTLVGYRVYMGIVPDIMSIWEVGQTSGELEWTEMNMLENGNTYYFAVAGYNDYDMEGDLSDLIEVYYRPYPPANNTSIAIHGDQEFAEAKIAYGWDGDGTSGDPYIIEDLVIDGVPNGYCLQIWNTNSYFVVRNCTFYMGVTLANGKAVDLEVVNNGRFEQCTFLGDMDRGLSLITGQIEVVACLFDGPMNYGSFISDSNTLVSDCTFNSTFYGMDIEASMNIVLDGNLFLNCYYPIAVWNTDSILVRDNEFHGGNAMTVRGSSECLVENNLGVGVYEFFYSSQSNWVTLRNNTANGTMMSRGAYSELGAAVLFENNTFSEFDLGMRGYGTIDLAIRNNTLFDNRIGMRLELVITGEVSGNMIRDSLEHGSDIGPSNQDVLVTLNTFIDNLGFAINCEAELSSATICLNHFQGNNMNNGTFTYATAQARDLFGILDWELDGLGNHWADWTSPDMNGDGIVDEPYLWDDLPLVHLFGAPTGLDAEVGPDHVNLSWGELNYDFSEGIDGYNVYRGPTLDDMAMIGTTTSMWYNDTAVILGTTYYYRVSANVSAEEGAWSGMISATPCDVPGAPTGLTVEGGHHQFILSWTAPANNGGSQIIGYNITRIDPRTSQIEFITLGDVTTYTDDLVGDDETYHYAVAAFNQAGNGSLSATVVNKTFGYASAPLNVTTQFGNGNVTVYWSAPLDDGGTPITGYIVEFGIDPIFYHVSLEAHNRSCLITDLVNGMEYSFRVLADNLVLTNTNGTWSPAVFDTPATVPGVPEMVSSATGTGVVRLSWLPPSDDGGAVPASYIVYRMELNGVWGQIGIGSELVYEDPTVSDGVVYLYRVSALNKAGEGDASEPVRAFPGPPSPPMNLTASNINGRTQLNWTSPSDDGGSDVLGYKIYRDDGAGFVHIDLIGPDVLGYLDTTAAPGIEHSYRVTAVSVKGEGSPSNVVNITLPPGPPEAPVIVSAVQAENGVLIAWQMPESSTIPDGFLLLRGEAADSLLVIAGYIDGNMREYLDASGEAGLYYAMMAWSEEYGVGEISEVFLAMLGIVLVPDAPQGLTAMAGDSSVNLDWIASDGAVGYNIYRDNGTGYSLLAVTSGTEYADSAVVNGIACSYLLTAYNGGGESGNSTAVLVTPGTVPGAVQNLTLTEGEAVATLNWDAPADDGGSAVQGYRIYRDLNGTVAMLAMVNAMTYSDHAVVSGLPHTYWIVALNAWGAGPGSARVNVTPDELAIVGLPAPSYLLATVGNGTVTLTWDPMTAFRVDGFVVLRSDGGNFSFLATRSDPTYTDTGLVNGATYTYRVQCFIGASKGENASVDATPGTAPGSPKLNGQTMVDRISLSWSVPENGGSAIIGYRLYRTPGTGTTVLLASLTGTTYVDNAVLTGVNLTYMVTAFNAFGEGAPSNTRTLRTSQQSSPATDAPAGPYLSSVTGGNASISLLWNVPSDTGDGAITGYNVYRGTSPLAAQLLVSVPAGTTTYLDGTAVYGSTYYYWVSALNQWGESELSRMLSASLVALATPGEVDVDVDEGQGRITLSWSVPDEGSSSVTEYRIYRRGETGDRQLIATVPAGTDTFVDGSVEAGVEYDYWVTAVNSAGEGPLADTSVAGVPLAIIDGEAEIGPMPMIALVLGAIGLLVAVVAVVLVLRKK